MQRLTATPQLQVLEVERQPELGSNGHSAGTESHSLLDGIIEAQSAGIVQPTLAETIALSSVSAISIDAEFLAELDSVLSAQRKRTIQQIYCPACGQSPCESARSAGDWPFGKAIREVEVMG